MEIRIDEIGAGAYRISVFVAVRLRPPDLYQTILCSTVMNREVIDIGREPFRCFDRPHMPHCLDAGLMFEETTSILLYGTCSRALETVRQSPRATLSNNR